MAPGLLAEKVLVVDAGATLGGAGMLRVRSPRARTVLT
jgi:hypothetical protein